MKRLIIHNFLCTLCLICIYYETDLIYTLLYSVISYPSLKLKKLFHKLRLYMPSHTLKLASRSVLMSKLQHV
jgi:hypothetical protein